MTESTTTTIGCDLGDKKGGSSYRVMGHGLVEDERYDPKRR
jgi:hypothetical protein